MPPFGWPAKTVEVIQKFDKRHGSRTAGALFLSAVGAVDSIYYLDDLDKVYGSSRKTIGGHDPAVVDIAHARWATSACFTALDLCAAGLARALCGHRRAFELSLAAFDPKSSRRNPKRCSLLRSQLPADALKWIDGVRRDP